jgi:hypothetical protein
MILFSTAKVMLKYGLWMIMSELLEYKHIIS